MCIRHQNPSNLNRLSATKEISWKVICCILLLVKECQFSEPNPNWRTEGLLGRQRTYDSSTQVHRYQNPDFWTTKTQTLTNKNLYSSVHKERKDHLRTSQNQPRTKKFIPTHKFHITKYWSRRHRRTNYLRGRATACHLQFSREKTEINPPEFCATRLRFGSNAKCEKQRKQTSGVSASATVNESP